MADARTGKYTLPGCIGVLTAATLFTLCGCVFDSQMNSGSHEAPWGTVSATPIPHPQPTVTGRLNVPTYPAATNTSGAERFMSTFDTPSLPSPSPTATNTLVPPPPLPASVLESFLFSLEPDPSCQLPCWHGLRVGVSNRKDIQRVFDTVFGFDGRDIFADPHPWHIADPPDGLDLAVEIWGTPNGDLLLIEIYVDKHDSILQAISFTCLTSTRDLKPLSPQWVLQELGPPSDMRATVSPEPRNTALMDLYMIHNEGIAFVFRGVFPAGLTYTSDGVQGGAEFCFGEHYFDSWVYITEPFVDGANDLLPLQKHLIYIPGYATPVQEVFNISPEGLAELAQKEQDPCIYVDLSTTSN